MNLGHANITIGTCINLLHKAYTLLQSCEETRTIQWTIVEIAAASCVWMVSKPTFRQSLLSPSPGTCLPPKSVHVMIYLPELLDHSLWLDTKIDGWRSQGPALFVPAFTFINMSQKRAYLFPYTHCFTSDSRLGSQSIHRFLLKIEKEIINGPVLTV